MKKIDLTFGIPAYNASSFIKELLDCFQEKSDINYEILIVDDGSNDNTFEVCKNYKNKNIRVLHKENGGVSSARNYIIDNALGEYIVFVDSDDLIDFDSYVRNYKICKKNNYDYYINVRNQKKYNYFLKQKDKLPSLIETEKINVPWDKFFKLKIIKDNNIRFNYKYSIGEDFLFNITYVKCIEEINIFCDKMYKYRVINSNSLSHKYRSDKFEELMSINRESIELYKNDKRVLKSLEYIRIKNYVSCLMDTFIFKGKFEPFNKYIYKMKKYSKKKYLFLNNLRTTLIYYFWYYTPNWVKRIVIKKYTKMKGKIK